MNKTSNTNNAVVREEPLTVEAALRTHRGLIVWHAKRFVRAGVDIDDLIAEGSLAMVRAWARFDRNSGASFSTFASVWIRRAMAAFVSGAPGKAGITRRMRSKLSALRRASAEHRAHIGEAPGPREIAEQIHVGVTEASELLSLVQNLSAHSECDERRTRERNTDEPASEASERTEVVRSVRAALNELDTQGRAVIELRFGLRDGIARDVGTVARSLNMRPDGVRLVLRQAIARLVTRTKPLAA